jgi:LmbE family N-acetylglucosaminyl deacetylase
VSEPPANVVVIAPHPDDEAIGCGGTIRFHVDRGDHVCAIFLTSGELGLKHLSCETAWQVREDEARNAAKILGIASTIFLRQPDWCLGDAIEQAAAALRPVLAAVSPGIIYVPHTREWHPDHRAAIPILRAALAPLASPPPAVLAYEVWTPLAHHDSARDVTSKMKQKLKAVRCYRSQLEGFRYDRAVLGLGIYRGALVVGCPFAEVFQSVPVS